MIYAALRKIFPVRTKYFKIQVTLTDKNLEFPYRSRTLPEIDDEFILYYQGDYHIVKTKEVIRGRFLKVIAREEVA